MRPLEWALIQLDRCPFKKRNFGHTEKTVGALPPEERDQEKVPICMSKREASEDTKTAAKDF